MLDLNVAVFHPSEGRKPFSKGSHTGLHLWVALSEPVQERHAPQRSGCCPRAASGQRAAPPSSVMNSRRFIIRSPRRRGRAATADFEAERLCGLEVDYQFELGRRLHRQVGRLLALEDAIDIDGRAPVLVDRSGP